MTKVEVPIRYGLPPAPPRGWLARLRRRRGARALRSSFPYTAPTVLGGCIVSDDNPRAVFVYACAVCLAAEHRWHALRLLLS